MLGLSTGNTRQGEWTQRHEGSQATKHVLQGVTKNSKEVFAPASPCVVQQSGQLNQHRVEMCAPNANSASAIAGSVELLQVLCQKEVGCLKITKNKASDASLTSANLVFSVRAPRFNSNASLWAPRFNSNAELTFNSNASLWAPHFNSNASLCAPHFSIDASLWALHIRQ